MTPNKNKRPLPSSTSMAFPEPPETFLQWKAALMQVSILYMRGQWKHCVAQCNQLLLEAKTPPHPLHATYLHFYSAVSNEAIARLAHNLSPVKIQLLEQAKASYQAAASSLPQADISQEYHDGWYIDNQSTCSTLSEEKSDAWNHCPSSTSSASQHEYSRLNTSSPSTTDLIFAQPSTKLKPSPLRIRKIASFKDDPTNSSDDEQQPVSPYIRSPTQPPQQLHRPTTPSFTSVSPSSTPLPHSTYTASLHAFSSTITTHIATVTALVEKTQAVQNARYFTKRLAGAGGHDDEETKAANLRYRIARLKARGWKVDRFEPGRYRVLCERALAEL